MRYAAAMSARTVTAAAIQDISPGTRVQVTGRVRSTDPVESPHGGPPLVGYAIACSVFVGRPGLPEFDRTHQVVRWNDAVLEDSTGTVELDLDGSFVRAPAGEERHLHELEDMQRVLKALGLQVASPVQLQLLDRSVPDGTTVTVTGVVDVAREGKGAFRSSARPRVVLRGDRTRPLVLMPR